MSMQELYKEFGLDANSQCFIGHAMALHTDDTYQIRPALETIEAVKVYGTSVGRYGQNSPYLYPQYGLSNLPEASLVWRLFMAAQSYYAPMSTRL